MSTALKKIGLPVAQADGARLARSVRQVLEHRDAAFARVEAEFRARMKALLDESVTERVSEPVAVDAPAPAVQ